MKNSARTRAARAYQAANPGTSYTRALRAVATTARRRPLIATIGQAGGSPLRINLDEPAMGGQGPYATIVGAEESNAAELLSVLADALHRQQVAGDLELVYSSDHPPSPPLTAPYVDVKPANLADRVVEVIQAREVELHAVHARNIVAARAAGHRLPTVLVLVDRPDNALVSHLQEWLRCGRTLGIHFVVCTDDADSDARWALDPHTSMTILVEEPGRGTVHNHGLLITDVRDPDTITPFTFQR